MRGELLGLAVATLLVVSPMPARSRDIRVSELHFLGAADPTLALALVQQRLSPEGKAAPDETGRALVVLDYPERQAEARAALERLQSGARLVRVEARFVDRETSLEAGRGETGQLLLPAPPASSSPFRSRAEDRAAMACAAREEALLFDGAQEDLLVGRGVPYVGWLLGFCVRREYLEPDLKWRDVGTAFAVELAAPRGRGVVHLALTPVLSFTEGRSPRRVALAHLRSAVELPAGGEVRLRPTAAQEEFFSHFLAGYDPLRQVRRVDMLIRAAVIESAASAGP